MSESKSEKRSLGRNLMLLFANDLNTNKELRTERLGKHVRV